MVHNLSTAHVLKGITLAVGASVEFEFAGNYPSMRGEVVHVGDYTVRVKGARGAVSTAVVNVNHGDVSVVMNGPKTRHVRAVRVLA